MGLICRGTRNLALEADWTLVLEWDLVEVVDYVWARMTDALPLR